MKLTLVYCEEEFTCNDKNLPLREIVEKKKREAECTARTNLQSSGSWPLTIFEPFLNHVSVSGGFPAHLQFRVTSESTSTVFGCGSTSRMGPTGDTEMRAAFVFLCLCNNAAGLKGRSCSEEERGVGEATTTVKTARSVPSHSGL